MESYERELVENALRVLDAKISELMNLRSTYVAWLNGEQGYGHLPPQPRKRQIAKSLAQRGKPKKCSLCHGEGHNRATCTEGTEVKGNE